MLLGLLGFHSGFYYPSSGASRSGSISTDGSKVAFLSLVLERVGPVKEGAIEITQ